MSTLPPKIKNGDRSNTPTWRERVAALRYIYEFLRMVWGTHRTYTLVMAFLRLLRAFVPVATLWVGKLIIDTVVAATTTGTDLTRLWKLVALEIGIVIFAEILSRCSALVESLLGDLFSNHTSVRLMQHAAILDLYQFENPKFYDQLERARRQTTGRIALLSQLFTMGQDLLTIISLAGALLFYVPWLLILLIVTISQAFLGKHILPRLSIPYSSAERPNGGALIIYGTWGRATRPLRKCKSLVLLPGWRTVFVNFPIDSSRKTNNYRFARQSFQQGYR